MNTMTRATPQNSLSFMLPTNMQEAIQFAEMLAQSELVPKDYQRKAGNILVAMQWGAEIGMQPLQSLQNISCINGRPAIWGDAMLALVRQSGCMEYIKEWDEGDTAYCEVKRKGAEPRTTQFSVEDAKRAQLINKQGPWSQYPKRMRQMRARAYALRDEFTDVLKGMRMAEEVQDEPVERDVSPETAAPEPKKHSGSGALKDRLNTRSKKQDSNVVEGQAVEFDVVGTIDQIDAAETLEQLSVIANRLPANIGEPAKTDIKTAYRKRKAELTAAAVPAPEPEVLPMPEPEPEPVATSAMMPPNSINAIKQELMQAQSLDDIEGLWKVRVSDFIDSIHDDDYAELDVVYAARCAELNA